LKRPATSFGGNGGQAIILLVVAMGIFMMGALGLAIDGGQMYAQRQMAQAAADAGAQAGILSIMKGTNATSSYPFGTGATPIASSVCTTTDGRTPCVYARFNGFGGTAADTVTLSFPSTVSGVTLSSASVPALTVTVQRTIKTGLIRFLGAPASSSIMAKATTGLVGAVSPDCIYVLDPSAKNAFQATGSANVTVSGCAIAVNSTNSDALTLAGAASVSASAINVTGGDVLGPSTTSTPAPVTGKTPVADPFASLPALAAGACAYTNYSKGAGTWTLDPGVYCGGISLHNSAVATLNPGTYIIDGGGVAFSGAAIATGNGVMFYLTGTNATYGSLTIGNSANVTLSALTSGPYMGVLFFQDRSITSASNAAFSGAATTALTGTLYFPTTSISFGGSASAGSDMAVVANQVSFTGASNINYDPTGLKTGLFSESVALVQ
jgi:Flp pilus assembly protein TadG